MNFISMAAAEAQRFKKLSSVLDRRRSVTDSAVQRGTGRLLHTCEEAMRMPKIDR